MGAVQFDRSIDIEFGGNQVFHCCTPFDTCFVARRMHWPSHALEKLLHCLSKRKANRCVSVFAQQRSARAEIPLPQNDGLYHVVTKRKVYIQQSKYVLGISLWYRIFSRSFFSLPLGWFDKRWQSMATELSLKSTRQMIFEVVKDPERRRRMKCHAHRWVIFAPSFSQRNKRTARDLHGPHSSMASVQHAWRIHTCVDCV